MRQENFTVEQLDWQKGDGLLPAIVQHATDGGVLMLGYMNRAALEKTLSSQKVTFFSRSKQRLWTKGETSGNFLQLHSIAADCDQDTLLLQAMPHGPTCHTGSPSCFGDTSFPLIGSLMRLEALIAQRASAAPNESYTARLLDKGTVRCAQKVGEEGVEVALAAATGRRDELVGEAADLLYHLLVCLRSADVPLEAVLQELRSRRK